MSVRISTFLLGLALSIFCCSTSTAQSLEQKISYSCAGIPVKTALEEISKQSGLNLATNSALSLEPLIVTVENVKLQNLLDWIAVVVDGNWITETDGVRRLVANKKTPKPAGPDPKIVERMKKAQAKTRSEIEGAPKFDAKAAQALVLQIEEHIRAISATQSNTYDQKGETMGQQGPISRLLKRIFVELDPLVLAKVTKSDKAVFSSRPTRAQFALPQKCLATVRQFEAEQAVWLEAVGSRTFQYPQDRGLPTSIYNLLQKNFDWNMGSPEDDSTPMKLLLFLTSYSANGADTVEVKLVDRKGKYIGSSSIGINELAGAERQNDFFSEIQKPTDPNEPDVELSDVSNEFIARLKIIFEGQGGQDLEVPPTQKLEQILVFPEKNDPMSLAVPETLFQLAKYSKKSVVASPPDIACFLFAAMTAQGSMKASKFVQLISSPEMGVNVVQNEDSILIGSKINGTQVPASLSIRFERALIGKVVRSIKENDFLPIDVISEVAYKYSSDNMEDILPLVFFAGAYKPSVARELEPNGGTIWCRLYGSLDVMQKRTLLSGKKLLLSELRPEQRQMIEKYVRNVRYGLRFQPLPGPAGEPQDSWETFHNGIQGEPSERWPNGLPLTATFQITESREEIVTFSNSEGRGYNTMHQTAEECGFGLVSRENAAARGDSFQPPEFRSFRHGNRRLLKLSVQLDPEVSAEGELKEIRYSGPKVNSLEQLPRDFLAKVNAAKARAIELQKKHDPPPPSTVPNSHQGSAARL